MDRQELANWWGEAHDEGVWWAPWRRILEDLTAEEAAWAAAPGRHCIWQIVRHMTFWRQYFIRRVRGEPPVTEEQLDRQNWQQMGEVSEQAWRDLREQFDRSHAAVRELLEDPAAPAPPKPQLDPRYLLFHDTYHAGQVMYIRALLGKPALES